jgi:hypothetical protein
MADHHDAGAAAAAADAKRAALELLRSATHG